MRNPTPAHVELGASDNERYPEIFIEVQPNWQAQQPHQQPEAPQQQPEQHAQMPQQLPQPIYQHGPPPAAAFQQPQQPLVQQPPQQLPMLQPPQQLPGGQPPLQFQWQIPAYQQVAPIPGNPGFAVQNWQTDFLLGSRE